MNKINADMKKVLSSLYTGTIRTPRQSQQNQTKQATPLACQQRCLNFRY